MTFTIRPAVRGKIGLLFGIAGASGSGKTFSALMLAEGIKGDAGKIAVIDTEAGRALHYAPKPGDKADPKHGTFEFLHLDFPAPFSPERYIEAIQAAEAAGATVIVIDSMSHEWEGEGGCSDQADQAAVAASTYDGVFNPKKYEAMTAPSWKKPKRSHKRMMSRLIQTRTHLIFCLRAQEKIKFEKVRDERSGREKNEIRQLGFMPICEKGFMFELSGSMTMHPETPGKPRYDLQRKLNDELQKIFPAGVSITRDSGERLRMWAETGEDRPPVDRIAEGTRSLIEAIQDASNEEALQVLTGAEATIKQRAYLRKNRTDLADRVDQAVQDALASFATDEDEERDAA